MKELYDNLLNELNLAKTREEAYDILEEYIENTYHDAYQEGFDAGAKHGYVLAQIDIMKFANEMEY